MGGQTVPLNYKEVLSKDALFQSPYLFILSAKILAKEIRSNENIKGISFSNTEIKISQYAEDTTFILNGT